MTRDELLTALLVERQTSPWWTARQPEPVDDEVTCARRRRDLLRADEETRAVEREAR